MSTVGTYANLHTSDWHLGRSFGDFRLLGDQRLFLDWLVEVCVDQGVELVAIAGDLFDRSVPPADAVALLRDVLRELQAHQIEVVAIAGNHDSAERLAAYDGLTEASGLVIRGGYDRAGRVDIRTYSDGPLAIAAVPFLDPVLAPIGFESVDDDRDEQADVGRLHRHTHDSVLRFTLDAVRRQTATAPRSIVLAHAFVAGGEASDSERELTIGAASMVGAAAFAGFSYSALGHLHRPQIVDGQVTIRYSGSPLPYSFSERDDQKQVVLVDMDTAGGVSTTPIPVPVGRRARLLRGSFDDVMAHPPLAGDPFVRVELTDPTRVIDAHRRLRANFPYLAEIAYIGGEQVTDHSAPSSVRMRALSPLEQVHAFWSANMTEELLADQEALVIEVLQKLDRDEVGS
ncbi:MAG: exonuclease SbcCD subunit D [Acidimicrobiales bacterium]